MADGGVVHTLVAGGAVCANGMKESILLETLAMRNMSNSRRSSSYGLIRVRRRWNNEGGQANSQQRNRTSDLFE